MVAGETSRFEITERLKPALAIVDLSLDRSEGLHRLTRLRSRCPDPKLIVISVHDQPGVCRAAQENGADGFVLRRSIATDFCPAMLLCNRAGRISRLRQG